MLGEDDLPEATLSEFLENIVLAKAIHRIEVLSLRCIQCCFVFQVFHVLVKELVALRIKQSEFLEAQCLQDVSKCRLLTRNLELKKQFILI